MELLRKLSETPGVSGREETVRRLVAGEMERLVDTIEVDALGNLTGFKKGNGKVRLMLSAHMDEIGFLVSHIDDNGFLRIAPAGGFDPRSLFAQRVTVCGKHWLPGLLTLSTKPIGHGDPEERRRVPKVSDHFVDLGLDKEKVHDLVSVGDPVALARDFAELGDLVTGKALDDRAGIYVMLKALERLKKHEADIYAVASVQEEVGLRGATVSSFRIDPDISIALDVTDANDVPGYDEHEKVTELGKGVAIKFMDAYSISDRALVRRLMEVAVANKIPHQPEILVEGGTDAAVMQRARAGSAAATLSVPTRYIHTTVETCHKDDIESAVKLLAAFLETAS